MKILHVIANLAPRYGGPPVATMDTAIALASLGHEVHVFTTDQDGVDRLNVPTDHPMTVRGVNIHYFRSTVRRVWPMSWDLGFALRRHIRDFDIVFIDSLYLFHTAAAAHYCRKYAVPYIMRPHSTLDPYIRSRHTFRKNVYEALIERRNFRGAAAIHYTAEDEMRLATPYTAGATGVVVPLGLHLSEYSSLPSAGTFRAEFPEVGSKKIVLHFGRLNFKKGLDILVDAFDRVATERDDVHLVLAGPDDDGYGATVRRWIAERGLNDHATFTGMLQGELKLAVLRDADVFALPSYSENFGIAIAEAMACMLPVVISNKVNIWREIEKAGAGLVIDTDAQQCAVAISRILGDKALATSMGENGTRLVAERYNWDKVGSEMETLCQRIVEGRVGAKSVLDLQTPSE